MMPLHLAAMNAAPGRHTDIVNALAGAHNANVDAADEEGRTALMWAALTGHKVTLTETNDA